MRIPVSTTLKTRTGAPANKDARLINAYVEGKGDQQSPNYQTAVRKRPIAQGGVQVGSGTAQGMIGFNIGSTPYLIGVWGDTLTNYTGGGTSWNVGTSYAIGDHVSYGFKDYWATTAHSGSQPPSANWSSSYVPAVVSVYHDGTLQNSNGGWGWSTLFNSFNIANICTNLNLVPDAWRYGAAPPYWPAVGWSNSSGVFQSQIEIHFADFFAGADMGMHEMVAAVSTNDGFIIASWPDCGGTLRLIKVTNSTYTVLADIAANATTCGVAPLAHKWRMNADIYGNCYILDSVRTMLATTKKISSAGVVTDLGVVPLPS